MGYPEKPQLHMVWPADRLEGGVEADTPSGYFIRTHEPGDEAAFLSLMATGEFDPWDDEKLRYNVSRAIPEGWFFAVEETSADVVGTAMCLHNYSGDEPFTGDVGWLACDPTHRGRGLGYALMSRVTGRFLRAGYSRIQLHTEYFRLPAIRIYLKQGYLPVIYSREVYALWEEACEEVRWTFTPDEWPSDEKANG